MMMSSDMQGVKLMAAEKWVTTEKKFCEYIQLDVELQERRVYPSPRLPDTERYRVLNRRCTADVACNIAGISCKWAFNNPTG